MLPSIDERNADPLYLRALVKRSGLSLAEVARRLGLSYRAMRYYTSVNDRRADCPYPVQFCLEALADARSKK